ARERQPRRRARPAAHGPARPARRAGPRGRDRRRRRWSSASARRGAGVAAVAAGGARRRDRPRPLPAPHGQPVGRRRRVGRRCGMSDAREARHYRLTHLTTYPYPQEVTSSYGRAVLLPRPGGGQQVHASRLDVTPAAAEVRDHRDYHGNTSTYFHVTEPHTELQVRSSSVLTVTRRRAERSRLPNVPWELAAQAVRTVLAPDARSSGSTAGALAIAESRLASPL